jgi:carotenoid 1,2-hydratase
MTDRGRDALSLSDDTFSVGPSQFQWDGTSLTITIDERSVPHFDRVQGTIKLHPKGVTDIEVPLHSDGSHIWRPFAPSSDIEVNLNKSGWQWRGHGYFDANFGTSALEDDFDYWTWGRFPVSDGSVCFYDATRKDQPDDLAVALHFDETGKATEIEAPPLTKFRRSLWGVRRETRADQGFTPRQTKMMLDAPFYCRAGVETKINGQITSGVHEALDLRRFASPLLKPMLAVKVPRRRNWP